MLEEAGIFCQDVLENDSCLCTSLPGALANGEIRD